MKLLSILPILILSLGMIACAQSQVDEFETLSTENFEKEIQSEDILLVDVRTPQEYRSGNIKNAVNWNFYDDNFISNFEKIGKDKPIYLYCRSGGRSGQAAQQLIDAGFKKVHHLEGGFMSWQDKEK